MDLDQQEIKKNKQSEMKLVKETKYTYKDLYIVPSAVSDIDSREECTPFYSNGMLPLFTAPMTTVVGIENYKLFEQNGIHSILPRPVSLDDRLYAIRNGYWAAFSLNEFEELFMNGSPDKYERPIHVLVDIANGHMRKLFDDVKETKQKWGNKIVIMIGNIANPKAYEYVAECGADYVRLGIGGGFGCITTTQTGVHYPMASLILDTIEVKKDIIKRHLDLCGSNEFQKHLEFVSKLPRIVADGGIRNFDDICKALALGADYVMIGSLFSKMYESTGTKFYETDKGLQKFPEEYFENLRCENDEIWYGDYKDKEYESLFKDIKNKLEKKNHKIGKLYKIYYGMASKKGQIDLKGKKEQISEGTTKTIQIEYTMEKWVKRCIHYLRTAMSYTDCETIDEFKIKPKLIVGSSNAIFAVNK